MQIYIFDLIMWHVDSILHKYKLPVAFFLKKNMVHPVPENKIVFFVLVLESEH